MHPRSVFDLRVLKDLPGFLTFKVEGPKARIFLKEAGGHRWQRIPPTEKRGRVHTSSVTVAVLENEKEKTFEFNEDDVVYRMYKSSGKGGQHRNKTESAVEAKHIPTGITAKCDSERSQHDNKYFATELLKEKLESLESDLYASERSSKRQNQIGSGLRGDKVQTVQEQNGQVTNHLNGKRLDLKQYFKGNFDKLH